MTACERERGSLILHCRAGGRFCTFSAPSFACTVAEHLVRRKTSPLPVPFPDRGGKGSSEARLRWRHDR